MFLFKIGEFFKKNWIRMLVSFVVGLVLMAIYNASYAATGVKSWQSLEYYRDGAFISFMVITGMGLLALLAFFGAFDIFSYYPGRKKKDDGRKETYGEYVERKNLERGKFDFFFLSYILIALMYAIFSLILFFILR